MILEKSLKNKYIWIVILGILLSFGISINVCKPEQAVKQIATGKLVHGGDGWKHIGENPQTIYLQDNKAWIKYSFSGDFKHSWNYREFYISDLKNSKMIQAEVVFYDEAGNHIAVTQENWGNGYNLVSNPVGQFKSMRIYFYNQENTSFTINGLRFTENLSVLSKKKVLIYMPGIFCIYLLMVYFLTKRVSLKKVAEELLSCTDELFGWMEKKIRVKLSKYGRILLWSLLLTGAVYIDYLLLVGNRERIRYVELGILIIGLLIGHSYFVFPIKQQKEITAGDILEKSMRYIWLAACFCLAVSDFFVEKKCQFIWIIVLFAGGYLLYQLNHRNCIREVFIEFELGFMITCIIVVGFRAYLKGIGMWQVAEPMGLHDLFMIWKSYLLNMNLFGHENVLFVTGRKILPYNGTLKAGYVYGIAAVLPYILWWAIVIRQSVICFLQKKQKAYLGFVGIITIFLLCMFMNGV